MLVPQWFSGARRGGQVFKSYIKARGRRQFLGAKVRCVGPIEILCLTAGAPLLRLVIGWKGADDLQGCTDHRRDRAGRRLSRRIAAGQGI